MVSKTLAAAFLLLDPISHSLKASAFGSLHVIRHKMVLILNEDSPRQNLFGYVLTMWIAFRPESLDRFRMSPDDCRTKRNISVRDT